MIHNNGQNLIFLVSQPRAGSTMTQKILGGHPAVHTASEPWIMLPHAYMLKDYGLDAEYGADVARTGIRSFIDELAEGEPEFNERTRNYLCSLYGSVLEKSGKQLFLDKTPRYYFIIDDLKKFFPETKIILLIRNPMAVLASIISTWVKGEWHKMSEFRHDLFTAPDCLIKAIESAGTNDTYILRYEDMVSVPESSVQSLCGYLGIEYRPEMINYGVTGGDTRWRLGDQDTVNAKGRPDSAHADKWPEVLADPQAWRIMHDYLIKLGPERISALGYDYNTLEAMLNERRPSVNIEKSTIVPEYLYQNARDCLLEIKRVRFDLQRSWEKNDELRTRVRKLEETSVELSNINVELSNINNAVHLEIGNLKRSISYRFGMLVFFPFRKLKSIFR
jgi:hypothetical protein